MCPTNPTLHSFSGPVEPSLHEYFEWISSAQCTASLFYKHRIEKEHFLCDNLYWQAVPETRAFYELKLRHYIHIGYGDCREYCTLCNVLLATRSALYECSVCIRVFEGYLRHIEQSDDIPSNLEEATIVAISEDRVC